MQEITKKMVLRDFRRVERRKVIMHGTIVTCVVIVPTIVDIVLYIKYRTCLLYPVWILPAVAFGALGGMFLWFYFEHVKAIRAGKLRVKKDFVSCKENIDKRYYIFFGGNTPKNGNPCAVLPSTYEEAYEGQEFYLVYVKGVEAAEDPVAVYPTCKYYTPLCKE